MMMLETLTQVPKQSKKVASSTKEQQPTLSFESFLRSLDKKGVLIAPDQTAFLDTKEAKKEKIDSKDMQLLTHLLQAPKEDTKELKTTLLDLLKKDDSKEQFQLDEKITSVLNPTELKYLVYKAKQYLKEQITQTKLLQQANIKPEELPNNLKSLLDIAQKLKIDVKAISFDDVIAPKEIKTQFIQTKQEIKERFIPKGKKEADVVKSITTKLERSQTTSLFQTKQTQTVITTKELIDTKTKKEQPKQKQDLLHTLIQKTVSKTPSQIQPSVDLFQTLQNTIQTQFGTSNIVKEEKKENLLDIESLEALLKDPKEEASTIKVAKADSFEVKMQEAKQMMRYLSQDIKKAIDEYKPPFSRVKVQLNPQRLGEIDLTVVQRGQNVHINLSSNNAAINILTNNLTELKTQLQQSGINNASFNFNSSSQQQNQEHERQKASYEYFAKEDDEEFSNSLEIIIPQYV